MTELEPRVSTTGTDVEGDLRRFEDVLLTQLASAGLPTEDVLVDVDERGRMLGNVAGALIRLGPEDRVRSYYVSKMIAAVAVGLFDAALNYLWDETVSELRRRIAGYDLGYFFDIAVNSPDRRKQLSTADDLVRVDDVDLLRACREIGLISAVGHAQLDHIRYMRNYASAAHPNQVELTGLQLAQWLESCIREVITLPLDTVTAETGKLLRNIKATRLAQGDVGAITAFFDELPGDRADALAAGLFGLYTDSASTPETKDNVRLLWPELWPAVSEDVRHEFGTKHARYTANADRAQSLASRELLDLVNGQAYLPDQIRAANLSEILDALLAAHHGFNNFYNEPSPARALEAFVGERGDVPDGVVPRYTAALVEVFLTNGHGVAFAADPIYTRLLERLDSRQAGLALRSIRNPAIVTKLQYPIGQQQWSKLLELSAPKLTRRSDRELLEAIQNYEGPLYRLPQAKKVQALLEPTRERPARRP
jgi:hypothetical protein